MDNQTIKEDSKYKHRTKVSNFEVHVEFMDNELNKNKIISETIMLMISSIKTGFKNGLKYIDLSVNAYDGTVVEESYIPNIKTIKICRYDECGNLLLTTVYNNCTFICNEIKHTYLDNNLPLDLLYLHVVYKFAYDNMTIEPNS